MDYCLAYLPKNYKYRVKESEGTEENLKATVYANLHSIQEADEWITAYSRISHTSWNVKHQRVNCLMRKDYMCHLAGRQGKKRGLTSRGKDLQCKARITIKIKKVSRETKNRYDWVREGLPAVITLTCLHNHSTTDVRFLSMRKLDPRVKEKFFKYFDSGLSAAAAWKHHSKRMLLYRSDEDPDVAALDRALNPRRHTVSYLYARWRTLNSKDEGEKEKKVENEREATEEQQIPSSDAIVSDTNVNNAVSMAEGVYSGAEPISTTMGESVFREAVEGFTVNMECISDPIQYFSLVETKTNEAVAAKKIPKKPKRKRKTAEELRQKELRDRQSEILDMLSSVYRKFDDIVLKLLPECNIDELLQSLDHLEHRFDRISSSSELISFLTNDEDPLPAKIRPTRSYPPRKKVSNPSLLTKKENVKKASPKKQAPAKPAPKEVTLQIRQPQVRQQPEPTQQPLLMHILNQQQQQQLQQLQLLPQQHLQPQQHLPQQLYQPLQQLQKPEQPKQLVFQFLPRQPQIEQDLQQQQQLQQELQQQQLEQQELLKQPQRHMVWQMMQMP